MPSLNGLALDPLADRTRLQPNSLLTGNFTGNFAISGLREPMPEQETAALQRFPEQFPKQINSENISMIREFLRDNRESIRQTRKRPFLTRLFLRGSNAICSHQQIFRCRTKCRQLASGTARLFGGRTTRLGFKALHEFVISQYG
jgi:hypothetical protein